MAKNADGEKVLPRQSPGKHRQIWWFDRDDEAFLQSLEDKEQAALLLSSELAAWFGDRSFQPPRV